MADVELKRRHAKRTGSSSLLARGLALGGALLLAVGCGGESAGTAPAASTAKGPATATDNGSLLAPPAPEDGIQIVLSGFDVPIGGETEVCKLFKLPNDAPIDVDGFEVAMPPGSHHFAVWSYNGVNEDEYPAGLFKAAGCIVSQPADSMNVALLAGSGSPNTKTQYPDGIGLKLKAHHPVLLNAHYVNATGAPMAPTVYVNIYYAKHPVVHQIENMVAANYDIFVPPGTARTTTARFTIPFDAYFLSISSHEHKRGDEFTARIVSGDIADPEGRTGDAYAPVARSAAQERHHSTGSHDPLPGDFYYSNDWEKPTVVIYDEPRLYPKGTVLQFSCTQHNYDKSIPVTFGTLADDEMCMLLGLYYRADTAPPPGTRIPGCLPQAAQLTCYADPVGASVSPGPAVCGNGQREGGEECDLGLGNGNSDCAGDCRLDLPTGTVLGTRSFPIAFSGPNSGTTDFINSVTRSSALDADTGARSSGPLLFTAGALDATGAATVSQDADVRIGLGTLGGIGSTCIRIAPSPSAGTLYCRGGAGVDLASQLDNLDGHASATDVQPSIGLGTDGGPGSMLLFLNASIATAAGKPDGCLTRDWSHDPVYPLPFTTGTTTGTIANADETAGNNLVMSATGENFDCARWSDGNGPGILQALTFLQPNNSFGYVGDVIAQLTLAGHEMAAGPEPTPAPTPGTPIGGEFAGIADDILTPRCAQPSCHSSQARTGNMVLERDQAYDQLVNQLPDTPSARARGLLRVAPGNPDRSFLLRKLTGDLDPADGTQMPQGNLPLADEEIARIRAWIVSGAQAQ